MGKRYSKKTGGIIVAAVLAVFAAGCGNMADGQAGNAVEGLKVELNIQEDSEKSDGVSGAELEDPAAGEGEGESDARKKDTDTAETDGNLAVTDFGIRLFQYTLENPGGFPPYASMPADVYEEIADGENVLISPLSVISALAMTAGGAEGDTLSQMEEIFGISAQELSSWLKEYREALPVADDYKLSMANSIWLTEDDRFTVEQDFLDSSERLFGADVRRMYFDNAAVEEINRWVADNTDGMIEKMLDVIPPDTVMCLVNALAFDAQWQQIYYDNQVREGEFTKSDGTVQKAEMMFSEESLYLKDEHAEGFLKYYKDEKYAFAALLPEEGLTVAEYAATLTGEKLRDILANPVSVQVNAAIPKYESEYAVSMNAILQEMGMKDAFDETMADFTGIGTSTDGNIYIDLILHKTFIAVDETGTKAGAATAVMVKDCAAMIETKTVHLDRPFLYMIIDCGNNLPVFIGAVEEMEETE